MSYVAQYPEIAALVAQAQAPRHCSGIARKKRPRLPRTACDEDSESTSISQIFEPGSTNSRRIINDTKLITMQDERLRQAR